jgi:hypothetical protein
MTNLRSRGEKYARAMATILLVLSLLTTLTTIGVFSLYAEDGDHDRDDHHVHFVPGNLVVSRSVYDNNANNVTKGMTLPPGCTSGCVMAISDGTYPFVFDNNTVDGSFGLTSNILLDELDPRNGKLLDSFEVPNSSERHAQGRDQLVTSFSSKSELALNLSTDGERLTFMGYVSPVDAVDVSNSNTPGVIDPTNPVSEAVYRGAAVLERDGKFHFTETNGYSGNNGRAAILNDAANVLYLAGNAGNGANPQPAGVIEGAGAQFLIPSFLPEADQTPPNPPTPLASFNITQLGFKADKTGKDTNFRGLTVFNNVVYMTKGSGGNGINTVYFVDTTGTVCGAKSGVGLPVPGAALPTSGLAYDPTQVATNGLVPYNMCVLKGFPQTLAKSDTNFFPFGIWFANANTLYVAQEGDGVNTFDPVSGTYTDAASQITAGIQKWTFNAATGSWQPAYTLSAGLKLGVPYTIPNYPTGNNAVTGLPWAPATDGVRNITGRVNSDGTATLYGITSTVSGNGDQGADPNKLVTITDTLSATTPGTESFTTLRSAGSGEVLRGVSFTPGTGHDCDGDHDRGRDECDDRR